ncbi:MAG TPA: 4-(cytidine 5'-diphospho)-2-C-methyl-D-erythritol kinase [Myxococcota bacterium]|nr:4-(cytidine 5'-diphospho)-2-C-methyl-D-erythritol kinase [Myxococcota bacterium]
MATAIPSWWILCPVCGMIMTVKIEIEAPAKINLYLRVLGRRPDGYHDIDTLITRISLADTVTIEQRPGGISVDCPGFPELSGKANLAYRAAELYLAASGADMGLNILIRKEIPIASGLGGGSSDAASVLLGLDRLAHGGLGSERLHRLACEIGADVPFFLRRGPCRARGIGHELEPAGPLPVFWVILACAPFGLSAREIYESLKFPLTSKWPDDRNTSLVRGVALRELASRLHNDLQAVGERTRPVIRRVCGEMLRAGAVGALMSGSGPAVFGLSVSEEEACDVREKIKKERDWRYLVAKG